MQIELYREMNKKYARNCIIIAISNPAERGVLPGLVPVIFKNFTTFLLLRKGRSRWFQNLGQSEVPVAPETFRQARCVV